MQPCFYQRARAAVRAVTLYLLGRLYHKLKKSNWTGNGNLVSSARHRYSQRIDIFIDKKYWFFLIRRYSYRRFFILSMLFFVLRASTGSLTFLNFWFMAFIFYIHIDKVIDEKKIDIFIGKIFLSMKILTRFMPSLSQILIFWYRRLSQDLSAFNETLLSQCVRNCIISTMTLSLRSIRCLAMFSKSAKKQRFV